MADISKMKVLMVYRHEQPLDKMRLALRNHIETLSHLPEKYEVTYYNAYHDAPVISFFHPEKTNVYSVPDCLLNKDFDVIIFHDTFLGWRWWGSDFYEIKKRFEWLSRINAIKIALPQDEYDHAEVLDEWLFTWNIDAVFTVCGLKNSDILFPLTKNSAQIHESLTGYINTIYTNPLQSCSFPPHSDRPYDIVYRSQQLPYSFGSHGQLKHLIADVVSEAAIKHQLSCDISNDKTKTILGSKWLDFMASGRCTIGTESGSSVIDFRGEKQALIRSLLVRDPTLSFEDVSACFDPDWDSTPITAISPRHLEAVITKTCQILLEGEYNNVLKPNIHYISLKKDYSNLDDILELIQDHDYTSRMADRAYNDIALSGLYDYASFARQINEVIEEIGNIKKERECINHMPKNDKNPIEVLEREIIALRHENARLAAKLQEAQYSGMTGVIRYLKMLTQQFIEKKF